MRFHRWLKKRYFQLTARPARRKARRGSNVVWTAISGE